jgi:hypothetical protein
MVGNHLIDKRYPTPWSKLIAVREALREFDYALYLDLDALIMNFEVSSRRVSGRPHHEVC